MFYRYLDCFTRNVGRSAIYLTTQSHSAEYSWSPLLLEGKVSFKNSTPT